MMQTLDVLGISGSLREKSYNTALLREAGRLAPAGMSTKPSVVSCGTERM